MKLSRAALRRHRDAMDLINAGRRLTIDEMEKVFSDFDPRVTGIREARQEFFTPVELASSLSLEVGHQDEGTVIVDMCAGIGVLSFAVQQLNYDIALDIHAIEINPDFVEIGQKLLPDVTWHCGDFRDLEIWRQIPNTDVAISNPPFGKIPAWDGESWLTFKGKRGALQAVEVGVRQAERGIAAIVPQSCSPIHYSGVVQMQYVEPQGDLKRFVESFPSAVFGIGSIDTSCFQKMWKGASPKVEIVNVEDPSVENGLKMGNRMVIPNLSMLSLEI